MQKHLLFTLLISILLGTNNLETFAQQHAKDLQIFSWSAPRSKGALTNNETVRFTIKNIGTEAISNFKVAFSQDGGNTFKEEEVTQTINSNAYLTYTFTSNFAVMGTDGATYPIIGKIILDGDGDLSNNEHSEEVINYLIGDVDDEPIEINTFPYSDSKDYIKYTNNYGGNFSIVNYMQQEDIVYSFTTTEKQMYVDAKVTAEWAGSFAPRPAVALIREKPSTFSKYSNPPDTESATGYGDWSGSFENGYCYYDQTYYLVVDKWRDYSCSYDLEVKLYRQHDFKFFSFEDLSVEGEIDYDNRIIVLTVPKETNVTALVPSFELPAYTEVLINDETQTSGTTPVDFSNDVSYTINQTISPNSSQTWTVKVIEETSTVIKTIDIKDVSIAPNPVNNEIHFVHKNATRIDKVSIFNTSGTIVLSASDIDTNQSLMVSDLKPGIYFIQLEINGNYTTQKFIKR